MPKINEIPVNPDSLGQNETEFNSKDIARTKDLVRDAINELDPKQRALKLLTELLVTNSTHQHGSYISPLSAVSAGQVPDQAEQVINQELFDSLVRVKEAIERDGGISESTYDSHKFAINSIARDLVGLRWWGSNLSHLCQVADRNGKKVPANLAAKYPYDVDFKERQHGHVNIFDEEDSRSNFEGTLFQTEFYSNGNLSTFRIFHQGHRDELSIRAVNIPMLFARIELLVKQFTQKKPCQQFGFTLDREEYLRKIEEFNAQFGKFVKLEIIGDRVYVKFNANPQQVAEKLVALGNDNGMKLTCEPRTGYLVKGLYGPNKSFKYLDLLMDEHMRGSRETFDPEKHKDTLSYLLLSGSYQEFSIELIALYATQ